MINVQRNFDIDTDFYDENPHFKILSPFKRLWDKSKKEASKQMWAIFLYCDGHPSKNPLYNLGKEDRKREIENGYFKINWDDKTVKECIEAWDTVVLTDAERSMKSWRDKLMERDEFLNSVSYDLDSAEMLDKLLANTPKLWEMFKKTRDEFLKEERELVGKGSRKMTLSEKAEI
jgi:hypothetical protein